MSLTNTQLSTLKAHILADQALAPAVAGGDYQTIANTLNALFSPDWYLWKTSVETAEVGVAVNYIAVEAMTDANRTRITTFYTMNPATFVPRSDIRSYWANTFSGALGGQGQASRDALENLWRRKATRAEKVLSTGAGSFNSPANSGWEGELNVGDIAQIMSAA